MKTPKYVKYGTGLGKYNAHSKVTESMYVDGALMLKLNNNLLGWWPWPHPRLSEITEKEYTIYLVINA